MWTETIPATAIFFALHWGTRQFILGEEAGRYLKSPDVVLVKFICLDIKVGGLEVLPIQIIYIHGVVIRLDTLNHM